MQGYHRIAVVVDEQVLPLSTWARELSEELPQSKWPNASEHAEAVPDGCAGHMEHKAETSAGLVVLAPVEAVEQKNADLKPGAVAECDLAPEDPPGRVAVAHLPDEEAGVNDADRRARGPVAVVAVAVAVAVVVAAVEMEEVEQGKIEDGPGRDRAADRQTESADEVALQ